MFSTLMAELVGILTGFGARTWLAIVVIVSLSVLVGVQHCIIKSKNEEIKRLTTELAVCRQTLETERAERKAENELRDRQLRGLREYYRGLPKPPRGKENESKNNLPSCNRSFCSVDHNSLFLDLFKTRPQGCSCTCWENSETTKADSTENKTHKESA